jgi:excisionase family DNA binding protein
MECESVFLSKKSAASMLAISLRTLDNLIAAKEIPVRRIGRRVVVSRRALEEFARRDHVTTKIRQVR